VTIGELLVALERAENRELEVVVEDLDDAQAWLGVTSATEPTPMTQRFVLRTGE
jgi:hypothetical protein